MRANDLKNGQRDFYIQVYELGNVAYMCHVLYLCALSATCWWTTSERSHTHLQKELSLPSSLHNLLTFNLLDFSLHAGLEKLIVPSYLGASSLLHQYSICIRVHVGMGSEHSIDTTENKYEVNQYCLLTPCSADRIGGVEWFSRDGIIML